MLSGQSPRPVVICTIIRASYGTGLCLPEGGLPFLRRHRARLQAMLGWDEARWAWEVQRYRQIWETSYQPPR